MSRRRQPRCRTTQLWAGPQLVAAAPLSFTAAPLSFAAAVAPVGLHRTPAAHGKMPRHGASLYPSAVSSSRLSSLLVEPGWCYVLLVTPGSTPLCGACYCVGVAVFQPLVPGLTGSKNPLQEHKLCSSGCLFKVSSLCLLRFTHPHYTTTPPNCQQLQGEAVTALGVLYSQGTHSGKSMNNTSAHSVSTHSKTKSQSYDEMQFIRI